MRTRTSLLYFDGGQLSSLFQGPFAIGNFQAPLRSCPEAKGSGDALPTHVKSSPSNSRDAWTSMTNRSRFDAPHTYNDG